MLSEGVCVPCLECKGWDGFVRREGTCSGLTNAVCDLHVIRDCPRGSFWSAALGDCKICSTLCAQGKTPVTGSCGGTRDTACVDCPPNSECSAQSEGMCQV
jgi:hypothetical protein